MENKRYIIGVGAANVDVHGRSRAAVVMRDSNPGHLHTSVGGVTRNVLENLARQGVETRLVSAVGDDVYGQMIRRGSEAAGIDMSQVVTVPGATSSCYIAILDDAGDMLLGMSDMSILKSLTNEDIDRRAELLREAAAIVCDPCMPISLLGHVLDVAGDTPVFLDPVSTAYARAVAPLVGRLWCVKPNRMELAVLADIETNTDDGIVRAADKLLSRGTNCVAVSLGERGCYWADRQGRRMFRALRPIPEMENATGAGDAFMSGLVHAHMDGVDVEEALDYALAAGIVAIKSDVTISPDMSDALVRQTIQDHKTN